VSLSFSNAYFSNLVPVFFGLFPYNLLNREYRGKIPTNPRLLISTELIYLFGISNGQDVFQVLVRASDDMSRNYFSTINALGRLYPCGH
jgi:hypothetical protein